MTTRRRMLAGETLTSLGVSEDGEILDDWEKIGKICKAGRAQDFYSVGNWKNVDYGSTFGTKKMVIFRFNYDDLADGTGKANTSWVCRGNLDGYKVVQKDLTGVLARMNCRSDLNDSVYNNIESAVKNNIKLVRKRGAEFQQVKILDNTYYHVVINETNDYLWILDKSDVFSIGSMNTVANKTHPWFQLSNELFSPDFVKDMGTNSMLWTPWVETIGATSDLKVAVCTLTSYVIGTQSYTDLSVERMFNSDGVTISPCFCI